jgi:hypothetical protein
MLTQEWLEDRQIKPFVICIKSVPFELCSQMYADSDELLRAIFANYIEVVKNNWILQPAFHLDTPYVLV